jgi:ubiquinone/menaquinone biosynthesis C-methylase UbiE
MEKPPLWSLPAGVSPGLWEYLQSEEVAGEYDQRLAASLLFQQDAAFVREFCQPTGRVIDLGCGTGRMLAECVRHGHRVLGVDLSQAMLKQARERGEREHLEFELVNANITQLQCIADASFDYGICLFSTLGMISGAACRQQALGHAHRLLVPGGKLLLHVHNRWFSFWDRAGRRWLVRDFWKRLHGDVRAGDRPMPVHQGVAGLALHHFSRREIVRALEAAGFRILEVRPVGLTGGLALSNSWWLPTLRAYGYLVAAEKINHR